MIGRNTAEDKASHTSKEFGGDDGERLMNPSKSEEKSREQTRKWPAQERKRAAQERKQPAQANPIDAVLKTVERREWRATKSVIERPDV